MKKCKVIAIANQNGGVVITLADMQTRLSKATEETLRSNYGTI